MADKTVIRLMDHVELLMPGEDHHDHGHHHHHDVHEGDEHIWTTPQNARLLAKAIGKGLMEQDPQNEAAYQLGIAEYTGKLAALEQQYEELKQTPKATLVVADRFPFTYLAHTYEIPYVAAFSGCTSNTEASLATLHTLASAAENSPTGVILHTEFSDGVLADTVASRVEGKTSVWHSCHNVTRQEWEEQVTYISLMEQNYRVLQEALGQ
jgi:zinc transport system substrate-binding protein